MPLPTTPPDGTLPEGFKDWAEDVVDSLDDHETRISGLPALQTQVDALAAFAGDLVYVTADQPFTATTTLADVVMNEELEVEANTIYRVVCDVYYNAPSTPDLKVGWSTTATGATFRWHAGDGVLKAIGDTVTISGDGTNQAVRLSGLLVVAGTPGVLTLRSAQATSDASPTNVLLGTWVETRSL